MQFQVIPGLLIFLGSYLPLAIILAIQDVPSSWWAKPVCTWSRAVDSGCEFNPFEHPGLALSFLAITAAAVALSRASLRKISFPFVVNVKCAKATPNEIINYTFPYVVSFMGLTYSDTQKLLGFAVFLLWMFAITFKSGQILMNPLLLVLKWRLYEATIEINGVERDVRVLKNGGPLVPGIAHAQTIQDFYIVGR
jgi:hypothetical protein